MARPTRTPKRRVKSGSSARSPKRRQSKRGARWEEKLSPQQKAAITRARRALLRAKPAEVNARREAFARALERAGAPARSRAARVTGATRERARVNEEQRLERQRAARRRRARERREREEREERERRERERRGWIERLSPQRKSAIERLRREFERAAPEATVQSHLQGQYTLSRDAYVRALQRAGAPAASIRALVAAVVRRRRRPVIIRQNALGPVFLDARKSRSDWQTLRTMVDENDARFREYMTEMLAEDYSERQGRDSWFSPEAI